MSILRILSEVKMSVVDTFALGSRKRYRESERLILQGNETAVRITAVKTCWWIKVNKKAVRFGPLDGATFPHIIYFSYKVGGTDYKGSCCVSYYLKCPNQNDLVTVFYDIEDPSRYAVKLYSSDKYEEDTKDTGVLTDEIT